MLFKNDPKRKIINALYELESEIRVINSIHNRIEDDFIHRFGLIRNNNHDNIYVNINNFNFNYKSNDHTYFDASNSNDDLIAVLTLINIIRIILSNIKLRVETLVYLSEVFSLLERTLNILNAIKNDINHLSNTMNDILDYIGLELINVNVNIEYSNPLNTTIELPYIDSNSIVYELPYLHSNCQH